MALRKIVKIDEDLCVGCGLCTTACHQHAIVIEGGKAKLRDYACDGLGKCLASCPAGAISFETREVAEPVQAPGDKTDPSDTLSHWPLQIKLVRADAPFFADSDLLVAADCTAFARAGFHGEYMRGKVTLIGCPKLDDCDYSDKLAQILANDVRSITVARMEVPCCSGLEHAVKTAVEQCGRNLPLEVVTISTDGRIV
ncbi:MAG: 4Fe-4S binding protein [Defluviitaleaceae bacterium]|nr:4Fe-4S binding protein [Defluviitaleaceae bacterium]